MKLFRSEVEAWAFAAFILVLATLIMFLLLPGCTVPLR